MDRISVIHPDIHVTTYLHQRLREEFIIDPHPDCTRAIEGLKTHRPDLVVLALENNIVPLAHLLDQAKVKPEARYVIFKCLDTIEESLGGGIKYYESIDLIDARHPQTIMAYGLNGKPLPVSNGAPLRCRVERQLGYKMAKYVQSIELTDSLAQFGQGHGGYWEDNGYDWYAGI